MLCAVPLFPGHPLTIPYHIPYPPATPFSTRKCPSFPPLLYHCPWQTLVLFTTRRGHAVPPIDGTGSTFFLGTGGVGQAANTPVLPTGADFGPSFPQRSHRARSWRWGREAYHGGWKGKSDLLLPPTRRVSDPQQSTAVVDRERSTSPISFPLRLGERGAHPRKAATTEKQRADVDSPAGRCGSRDYGTGSRNRRRQRRRGPFSSNETARPLSLGHCA